jgi:hypothetical protein
MKNLFRVTRPAWATMDASETKVIFTASLLLACYASFGEPFAVWLLSEFKVPTELVHRLWIIVDLILVTLGCLAFIHVYKRSRVSCYPSTFIYCFNMPEASNPSGKSTVLGYCFFKPDKETGEIIVEGASHFWENETLSPEPVGFTSTFVRGLQNGEAPGCKIFFDINEEDREKRLYRHGILEFESVKDPLVSSNEDAYAGFLRSRRNEVELEDVEVRAKGYAEWHANGCVDPSELQLVLQKKGAILGAKLKGLLGNSPAPTLWKASEHMKPVTVNVWKHNIPMPQSVMLNPRLSPHVGKYLSKVLGLFGLNDYAVKKFIGLAVQAAKREDTLVGYEAELKRGLINQTEPKNMDKALTERAQTIHGQIKPYFSGSSLLDIGCGNGMISNLARASFQEQLLLDVVEYVPAGFNLKFRNYTEGHALPIDKKYDTVLLLTVLHHASNPIELLKLAYEATNKRLIIIESVVGIHKREPNVKYDLVDMSDEDQIAFAAFVDWFYNRVLHNDVPVPYNFTTIEAWQSVFLQNNMKLSLTTHFGQDIEVGPEYHAMFVIDKT